MMSPRWRQVTLGVFIYAFLILGWMALLNVQSLDEGWHYWRSRTNFEQTPLHPLSCEDSEYTFFCKLSESSTKERAILLSSQVTGFGFDPVKVPIREGKHNILAVFSPTQGQPYVVLSAHYDKQQDQYPAAMDNTAGVFALVRLLERFQHSPPPRNVILSFSGEEETGFYGAMALLEWMETQDMDIDSVLAIDSIGRGHLYVGSMGQSTGIHYRDWLGRHKVFNPRGKVPLADFIEPEQNLVRHLQSAEKTAQAPISVYNRMVGWSEDLLFAMRGYPTARLYSDDWQYYFTHIDTPNDLPKYIDVVDLEEVVNVLEAYLRGN